MKEIPWNSTKPSATVVHYKIEKFEKKVEDEIIE